MRNTVVLVIGLVLACTSTVQAQKVKLQRDAQRPVVRVSIAGKHFTDFFFPDTIAKPVLYPIKAPNGTVVTRGFPVTPQPGEPTDHPHHLGLWLNYGDVNGLDFWNNSAAIPADKKKDYGNIRMDGIESIRSGETGTIRYKARWVDHTERVLLRETTDLVFSEQGGAWVVDRKTTLTAEVPVSFKDNKEGVLGLRVARALQIPAKETKKFTDANGIVTTVQAVTDSVANGNYLAANGLQGDDVWSSKAAWCLLYGRMKSDSVSILIVDHPSNVGYPTHWHARGYGLFAANPLGVKVFTKGASELNLALEPGASTTLRYRIVFASGQRVLNAAQIASLERSFAAKKD
jgi:hypothetical protein